MNGRTMRKLTRFVHPMLAKIRPGPFDDPAWIFETKWDGNRAIAEVGGDAVRFYSRNGLSLLELYPKIAEELRGIQRPMVLDGEVVALDRRGRPKFQLLQNIASHPRATLVYFVFDLLELYGRDVRDLPLIERKRLLRHMLKDGRHVRYCGHVTGSGRSYFERVGRGGYEGMMAKRANSVYRDGTRSGDWLKVKHQLSEEMVIGGYTAPKGSRDHFGALLLGRFAGGRLHYAGRVGTGFDRHSLADLHARMGPLVRSTSPFDGDVLGQEHITWLAPRLVCNVKFTEWTKDGELRHPVFLGLRFDKAARDVQR